MKIQCPKCHYEWDYKGKLKWVTCPNCMNKFQKPERCNNEI